MSRSSTRHRVFIGLNEVAGYYAGLNRGLAEIGVESWFLSEQRHPFEYGPAGPYSAIAALATRGRGGPAGRSGGPIRWTLSLLTQILANVALVLIRLGLLAVIVVRYDSIILAGGYGLFRGWDLRLFGLLGKNVICVFNGTDHRPPYLNRKMVRAAEPRGYKPLIRMTARVLTHVRTVEDSATAVVALSASAQLHRRPFVEFLAMGIPFVVSGDLANAVAPRAEAGPCRILHSPSDPEAKGTAFVRSIVASLRERGHDVELEEITNRPHREVIEAIRRCDFVIDEVYSDTPMAGLATEAAFYGKPTVGSGFYAPFVAADLSPEMIPPSLYCLPEALPEAVERMVVDTGFRTALGAAAAAFVREQWSPAQVARRFVRLIEGDIPASWMRDPGKLRYSAGWGMSEQQLRSSVKGVIAAGGTAALGVRDKPGLEAALVALASS